jgi:U2 small nuclear ribonucleoprotein B''
VSTALSPALHLSPARLLARLQVRMVEARPGIAFIEFDSDLSSTTAMSGLQGFKITADKAMMLSYAKQ